MEAQPWMPLQSLFSWAMPTFRNYFLLAASEWKAHPLFRVRLCMHQSHLQLAQNNTH